MAVVTATDRPKSVLYRCVIGHFGGVFVLSICPFDISVGIRAFVIGIIQISAFFLFLQAISWKDSFAGAKLKIFL